MAESDAGRSGDDSRILVRDDYDGQVTSQWFDPEFWGTAATPVDSGGRGSAWFLQTPAGALVLRSYLRGGFVANVMQSSYLYLGKQSVRSFAEFRLLDTLYDRGLPVPEPVAARYEKTGPRFYRAWILVRRIDGVSPLGEIYDQIDDAHWRRIGVLVRRFHDAGVFHSDLNCFNVLVQADNDYLIDFDKCKLLARGLPEKWKMGNLKRLARSLVKVAGESFVQRVWPLILTGYQGVDVRE
ncbi:3-deoxy-D-manno-octulosonic acid kinase [Marinobacter sp. 1Y8]